MERLRSFAPNGPRPHPRQAPGRHRTLGHRRHQVALRIGRDRNYLRDFLNDRKKSIDASALTELASILPLNIADKTVRTLAYAPMLSRKTLPLDE